jgi:hypothetical protein
MPLSFPTLCVYLIYKGDINLNYKKHYDLLIQKGKSRQVIEVYYESHHIIPRCMGGTDKKDNLVNLTAEEHYVAHQLLTKIYPDHYGLKIAAVAMATDNRTGQRSNNKLYSWLRKRAAIAQSEFQTGRRWSEEQIENLKESLRNSESRQEYYESRRGIQRTEEEKLKMSISAKTSEKAIKARADLHARQVGVPRSLETCKKVGDAFKGRKLTEEHKQNISDALKGIERTKEYCEKLSKGLQGNQNALGAVRSPETRAAISKAKTGTKMSPEAIEKMVNSKTPEQRRAGALKAWETKRANKSINVKTFIYNGEELTIKQLSDKTGISTKLLAKRLCEYNWPIEKAILPSNKNKQLSTIAA